MNTTEKPGLFKVRLSDQFGRISPTALQDATKAVHQFGSSMQQTAEVLRNLGDAAKRLDAAVQNEMLELIAKRPWYRRGRW